MGWQDRDWARWTDDERKRFYGAATPPPEGCARGGPPRRAVWGVLLTLVLSALGWGGVTHRHWGSSGPRVPAVVYGDQGVPPAGPLPPAAVGDPHAPGGSGTVCTDEIVQDGRWECSTFAILGAGQSAAGPLPSSDACVSERIADQATGRWVCAGGSSSLS